MLEQKSERELIYMRDAGRVVAETHRELKNALRIGMTTKELDQIAEDYIRSKGAVPSFKGYSGYPASICASVNDVVVHGIPDERVLNEGDIISLDIGAILNEYNGDAAQTLPVGEISPLAQRLLQVTRKAFTRELRRRRWATACLIFPTPCKSTSRRMAFR